MPVGVQELVVGLFLGAFLDAQDDVGAVGVFLGFGDGVAVGAGGFPLPGFVGAVGLGDHCDLIADHEGGVEAHAELADDVDVVLFLGVLFEFQGSALGDGAQVVFQLLGGHADAVVGDGQGPGGLVDGEADGEIVPVQAGNAVGQGFVVELINGVAGVGDQLPEENLPVGVDGVDHHVQQAFGFCFELLLCHIQSNLSLFFGKISTQNN